MSRVITPQRSLIECSRLNELKLFIDKKNKEIYEEK